MKKPDNPDRYSEAETARRRDAIVRNMIAMPPQKQKPLKRKARQAKTRVNNSKAR